MHMQLNALVLTFVLSLLPLYRHDVIGGEDEFIVELIEIANKDDYLESDIAYREQLIFNSFMEYLDSNGLIKKTSEETVLEIEM